MIDWVTILLALVIIAALVGGFGFVAWKINMSDPLTAENLTGKKDETNSVFDVINDKKRKDKNTNEQKKKKRTVQKKSKRENKEGDDTPHVKFIEPSTQTSEETDNEREESEQEVTATTPQVVETSSKARKRKNKARSGTPPILTGPVEGILVNKDEKSPVTDRPQPIPHPKLVSGIPKDEVELAKQHQQHTKTQVKPSQTSNKQSAPIPVTTVKKQVVPPTQSSVNHGAQKQQQQQQQEQPFTTVVGKGHKAPPQPTQQQQSQPPQQQQQQQQQQQTKSGAALSSSVASAAPPTAQQQAPVQVQHEQLAQRQPVRQQKETAAQSNGYNPNSLPVKQPINTSTAPVKIADLVKALPTPQVVVTELMSAFDAVSLSTEELNIIMQKIANKQSLLKHDWSKLQHGQRVDPQAHIGQILNESARASEEDLKTNAMKRMKELSDELSNDKRRINDLLKETNEKDMNIQLLRSQLNSLQHQHPQQQQQQFQTYEVEYRRLADENMQLKQRLTQQQQHFQQQQQQLSSLNLTNNNSDPMNVQARVVGDQIKKLSIENGKLEKQLQSKELTLQETQKEKDTLLRTNQQLSQKVQEAQKQFQHNEEKILKELNENRTLHMNQLNEYKRRIEELEQKNEQLRQVEMTRTEPINPPTLNNEERLKFEQEINQLTQENEKYKKNLDDIQSQHQSQQNQLRQEIEQLKTNVQKEESLNKELADKNTQIESLKRELEDVKARNDATSSQSDERLRQEHDKQKQFLVNLLEEDVRNQLPNDNQDFNQWLSSYQQLFASNNETSKRTLQEECNKLKLENDQLHKNMNDVENQLKDIEQTVQSKEESLFDELKNKDSIIENIQHENDQLSAQMQQLRTEIDRLQSAHSTAIQESQSLKQQLDERLLLKENINQNSSSNADKLSELIKQSPLLPVESNTRIDQLHELIRSGKEALENQDSIVQQLDKHLNDMHRSGTGETLITNLDDSSPSNQEQTPSES